MTGRYDGSCCPVIITCPFDPPGSLCRLEGDLRRGSHAIRDGPDYGTDDQWTVITTASVSALVMLASTPPNLSPSPRLTNVSSGRAARPTSNHARGGQRNDNRPGDLIVELLPDKILDVVEQSLPCWRRHHLRAGVGEH